MFDDQISNNQNQIPKNLPVGEPEDMLAGIDKTEAPAPMTAPLAGVSALEVGALKRKDKAPASTQDFSSAKPVESQTPAPVPAPADSQRPEFVQTAVEPADNPDQTPAPEMYKIKEPALTRGLVMTIIIVVAVVILGGGGWWLYNSFIADSGSDFTVSEFDATVEDLSPIVTEPDIKPFVPVEENLSADIIDEQVLFGEPIDTDGDGLDDNREFDLGTDPNNWDSDGDELGDGDEVIIWKTDPLNPDSDGDTYLDGQEVKSGYNPAGPGKIFEPPIE